MRLNFDIADHVPSIWAKFGYPEEKLFPVTFRANEKGGMDSDEFEKYVLGSIKPLFANAAKNRPGQRIILKVDSGPGRMNLHLFARLRRLGYVMYPRVPNMMHI